MGFEGMDGANIPLDKIFKSFIIVYIWFINQ